MQLIVLEGRQLEVLVVTAHPSPHSLNAALTGVTLDALVRAGHTVQSSDLHEAGWGAAVSLDDFGPGADRSAPIGEQAAWSYREGTLAAEIRREQAKLAAADLVVFHFPLWWYGMPAILKGWFDRVFTKGFAYGIKDEHGRTRKYGDGGLAGKRALTVITAGDRLSAFTPRGINGDAEELFFPFLHGIFWYTGMAPLHPHLIAGVDQPGWDDYDAEAERLSARLAGIADETAIAYRALADREYTPQRQLRDELRAGEHGLGIHFRDSVPLPDAPSAASNGAA